MEKREQLLVAVRWPAQGLLCDEHQLAKVLLEPLTSEHDVRGEPERHVRGTRDRQPRSHALAMPELRRSYRSLLP
ncbi:hypothetical protein [Mumia zhuanghuii]|uniref:Uncharacterized protein n=1 Tax=Mumia zhuanghuii TaxID=2585211 RepID=A0A5C4M1Y6_9ACTN|nr:hypothetical protein [Mumia zhuanghuii]TNC26845.1 hypothetical protein FHE65_34460 [Mumia zhuanghuii]